MVRTDKNFRKLLKKVKAHLRFRPATEGEKGQYGKPVRHDRELRHHAYAESQTAKRVHRTSVRFRINKTMRDELQLVYQALSSEWMDRWRPIGHLIPRDPTGVAWSDSCLHAAGGYSFDMGFWWYIEWPEAIKKCTLKFVVTDKEGKLITINALEFASLIINYAASTLVLVNLRHSRDDPHPVVLLWADNRSAEAWMIKASSTSSGARALGYIQAALMMNNPLGTNVGHVTSEENKVADRISRVKSERDILTEMNLLSQDFPQLKSCQRFHPNAELISLILETLSTKKFVNPLHVSRRVLACPGEITM